MPVRATARRDTRYWIPRVKAGMFARLKEVVSWWVEGFTAVRIACGTSESPKDPDAFTYTSNRSRSRSGFKGLPSEYEIGASQFKIFAGRAVPPPGGGSATVSAVLALPPPPQPGKAASMTINATTMAPLAGTYNFPPPFSCSRRQIAYH